jgi:hypothetical protein
MKEISIMIKKRFTAFAVVENFSLSFEKKDAVSFQIATSKTGKRKKIKNSNPRSFKKIKKYSAMHRISLNKQFYYIDKCYRKSEPQPTGRQANSIKGGSSQSSFSFDLGGEGCKRRFAS